MPKRLRGEDTDDDYHPSSSARPKRSRIRRGGSLENVRAPPMAGPSEGATTGSTADPLRPTSILSKGSGKIHDSNEKNLPAEDLAQEVLKWYIKRVE